MDADIIYKVTTVERQARQLEETNSQLLERVKHLEECIDIITNILENLTSS